MIKVSIVKCSSYSSTEVSKAVKQAFDSLGGLEKFVKPGMKVLLKVNLLAAHKPEEAATTHPAVVAEVAVLCKHAGAKVFIGDSPTEAFEKSAKTAGFEEVCSQVGAMLVELSDPVETNTSTKFAAEKLFVSKKLQDFDAIINLPKLKTHVFTGFTGAVKNLYGCVPRRTKSEYHLRFPSVVEFSKMLLDLHEIVKPQVSLMDAVEAMEGNGPSAGSIRKLGLLLASENALALDFAALKVVGFKVSEIPTIALAEKLGLIDYSKVALPKDIDFPVVKDFKRAKSLIFSNIGHFRFLIKFAKPLLDRKPVLLSEKCISCGKCFQICPAMAIDFKTKKPVFDYKKCIRCFCCFEVCHEKAIEVKESFAINALKKMRAFG